MSTVTSSELLFNPGLSAVPRQSRTTAPAVPGGMEAVPGWWLVPAPTDSGAQTVTLERGYARLQGCQATRLVQRLAEQVIGVRLIARLRVRSGAVYAGAVYDGEVGPVARLTPVSYGRSQPWQKVDLGVDQPINQVVIYCAEPNTCVDIMDMSLQPASGWKKATASAPQVVRERPPAQSAAASAAPPLQTSSSSGTDSSPMKRQVKPSMIAPLDTGDYRLPTIDPASFPSAVFAGAALEPTGIAYTESVQMNDEFGEGQVCSGLSLVLDTGETFSAVLTPLNLRDAYADRRWNSTVTFPHPGTHTLTAVATYPGSDMVGTPLTVSSDPLTVTVRDPALTITATPLTSTTVVNKLTVQASSDAGVQSVQWSTDQATWQNVDNLSSGMGTAALTMPTTNGTPAANGTQMTVYLRASNQYAATQQSEVITWVDTTAPVLTWQSPQDNSALELLGNTKQAQTQIRVTVNDADNGVVSSGVQYVRCTVDGGATGQNPAGGNPVQLTSVTGTNDWMADVTLIDLPGLALEGQHTLQLDCKDNAHNVGVVGQLRTVVVRRSGIQGTSEQDYLVDLVDFVRNRLVTTLGGSPAVTALHLETALCAPFRRLAGAGATRVGDAVALGPINAVRGAVEVLRAYLTPRPPAPIGHWPLDEGSGLVVRDDSGGGSPGTFSSASSPSWGPGRAAGMNAAVFDGNSGYVQISEPAGPLDQLDAGHPDPHVTPAVSIAAWINPSGPGSEQQGVIAGREGSYLLARKADGTVCWSLATPAPGWGWQDTTVSVPAGTWAHVAMSYDGSTVRIYLNGALQEEKTGISGRITPNDNEFRIGSSKTTGSFFAGSIAEVGVYDRPLCGDDVMRLAGQPVQQDSVWLDDPPLPTGAQGLTDNGNEGFHWTDAPTPVSGAQCHESAATSGLHQHFFYGVYEPWRVLPGDRLYSYVYLDPADPPQEVMLQWHTNDEWGWEHRAFWGNDSQVGWGVRGQPSRTCLGPLPLAGQWVRLEVPAALVGLDNTAVDGLAFTLYDGHAWWDRSGRVTSDPTSAIAGCGYLQAAYEAILVSLGTSSEELRTVRGAQASEGRPDPRAALAARLGFVLAPTRPDQLDELLLSPAANDAAAVLSDANLESLFGLQRTDADPLTPSSAIPRLQVWQEAALRTGWAAQDHGDAGDATDFTAPVVDPDVVVAGDIVDPSDSRGTQALTFLQQRKMWLTEQTAKLTRPDTGQGIPALVATQLDLDITDLADKRDGGYDIAPALASVPIERSAFARLVTLAALPDTLTDDEWGDVCAIVIGVVKARQFTGTSGWRQQEQDKGVVLDPALFQASAVTPDQLPRWRGSWATRTHWAQRLDGRRGQLADIAAGLTAAVEAGEHAALPQLRDALLDVAAPSSPDSSSWPSTADRLGQRVCSDLQVGPQLTTTRLRLAVEAVQVLLGGIDSAGDLTSRVLPWQVYTDAVSKDPTSSGAGRPWFDRLQGELSWMGQYSSWLAAMDVVLYPENHLLPSIRTNVPAAFAALAYAVTGREPPTSAQAARDAAAKYWDDPTWGQAAPDHLPAHNADKQSPTWVPVYPYTEQLTAQQLNDPTGGTGLKQTDVSPASNREVYFDLPLLLALSLRAAGQWQAALGWLRIIYDRDLPAADRWIFDVTKIEGTQGVTRDEKEWLGGGNLDPHYLASTRAGCYQRFTLMTIAAVLCDWADAEFTLDTEESRAKASGLYVQALDVLAAAYATYTEPALFGGQNPELAALIGRAQNGLAKLRAGLNIAGMARPLSTGDGVALAAPPATNFRYATLIGRAQQLANAAAQIEAGYLASLQQYDSENYQQLLAGQDLSVANAQVTVAADQARVAAGQVDLAHLQVQRAQTQSDTYASWIAAGPSSYEQDQLAQLKQQAQWQNYASAAQAAAAVAQGIASAASLSREMLSVGVAGTFDIAAAAANAAAAGFGDAAAQAAITAQSDALQASWERRSQEWSLQKSLADADTAIGAQQVLIAQGQATVASDQATVARLTQSNAEAKLQFLQTKFTNTQLYSWMAGVLGGVYRYFLQQAAAVARLAEQQLAFERQVPVPGYIKPDYWTPPSAGGNSPIGAGSTGGLTGSARLLTDVTQLDQFALASEQRKLQLTQTFSLATLAPVDLQRFRASGVLPFVIPADRYGAPGMYLATIRAVRISIAALIPPAQGIRGTLTSGGSSHIVVQNNDMFETVTLARAPETVALTSPANASGVFQVDLTPELLLPFEGSGLDLPFELALPRAINPFDYRTIADVQVSMDYTALYSPTYAAQVIQKLPARTSNTVLLSLQNFPEAWYMLVAQAQQLDARSEGTPTHSPPVLLASWQLGTDDLPPNLSDPNVEQLTMLVVRSGSTPAQFTVDHLNQAGPPIASPTSTGAKTAADIISTRNTSGATWKHFMDSPRTPIGTWELGLTADGDTINALASGDVQDIALVIGYNAAVPAWPT